MGRKLRKSLLFGKFYINLNIRMHSYMTEPLRSRYLNSGALYINDISPRSKLDAAEITVHSVSYHIWSNVRFAAWEVMLLRLQGSQLLTESEPPPKDSATTQPERYIEIIVEIHYITSLSILYKKHRVHRMQYTEFEAITHSLYIKLLVPTLH